MELNEYTSILRQRIKTLKISFWDIGMDLREIQEKGVYKQGYGSMKDYITENVDMSYDHALKMIAVTKGYSRTVAATVDFTKLYLLLQVPEAKREELIEIVKEEGMSRENLSKEVKGLKHSAGKQPHYSNDPNEHILKLKRQFESLIQVKEGLQEAIERWITAASQFNDTELNELIKIAKKLLEGM